MVLLWFNKRSCDITTHSLYVNNKPAHNSLVTTQQFAQNRMYLCKSAGPPLRYIIACNLYGVGDVMRNNGRGWWERGGGRAQYEHIKGGAHYGLAMGIE